MKLIKKNKSKRIVCLILSFVMINMLFSTKQIAKADWIEKEEGIQYENEEGELLKGFQEIKEKKYYFDKDGYLKKGKFFCEEDQQYYYANKEGVIQKDVIKTKDGFYIADENGCLKTGFLEYEGNRYFFNGAADMVKGWFKSDGNWYYAGDDGITMTGFITVDEKRYYLNDDGTRVSNTVMELDGVTYVFNEDGSVDENATAMYPVFQFVNGLAEGREIPMNSKVQACALLRAKDLINGYQIDENESGSIEQLLRGRGIRCSGGYEFSYGGVPDYSIDKLMEDMSSDFNLKNALNDSTVKEVGIGMYEEESILYFDFIFICE